MGKKMTLAVIAGLMLFLTSCERADLPNNLTESTLVLHKNGKVTEYLIEDFGQEHYDSEELLALAKNEALQYNTSHAEDGKELVHVKMVEMLENGRVLLVQEYRWKSVYADFNGCTEKDIDEERLPIKITKGK